MAAYHLGALDQIDTSQCTEENSILTMRKLNQDLRSLACKEVHESVTYYYNISGAVATTQAAPSFSRPRPSAPQLIYALAEAGFPLPRLASLLIVIEVLLRNPAAEILGFRAADVDVFV